jgi:hypothetical protein
MITRRTFIAGGAATAAAGIAGAAWLRSHTTADWIQRVVRSNLPGIRLDEDSLLRFVQDVQHGELFAPRMHRIAVMTQSALPWVAARIPKARIGLEKLERRVLTEYLLGSNFFRVADPSRETIVYHGLARVCTNPFVDLTQQQA